METLVITVERAVDGSLSFSAALHYRTGGHVEHQPVALTAPQMTALTALHGAARVAARSAIKTRLEAAVADLA